ncbi:MAG: NADP-dependent oxidoreductase [Vogesella sp.]|uniref:NADP-dependent oxidoreductase n=1 Tax=Vogesella sp. TaxID=1904252 RepID=UPI00391B4B15
MKAMRVHRFGGPEVLQLDEVPIPQLVPGSLLIRVIAAGVNPLDWKLRAGAMAGVMDKPLPFIPGLDGAGIVVALAGDVRGFELEDAVCFYAQLGEYGSYAEYAVVPAQQVARMPEGMSFMEAAALPTPAQAAWTALVEAAALQPGQRVLVHGAAGSLGRVAVQLARQMGAYVVAASKGLATAQLQALGADLVVGYQQDGLDAVVKDMDVVLDTLGGPIQDISWSYLRPGGVLVSTVQPPAEQRALAASARGVFVQTQPRGQVLAGLLRRHLSLPIVRTLSMQQAAEAHQLGEQGKAGGKMVLLMPARDSDLFV